MKQIIKNAEAGNSDSQNHLGLCYSKGQGVPQSHEKAVEWYTKAAEQGNAMAQCNLGNCYYDGRGVPQNFEKAKEWYEKAAAKGYEDGIFNLGWLFYKGEGVEQNYAKARELWLQSAAKGDSTSIYHIGVLYFHGKGVEVDKETAFIWFKKASDCGYIYATRVVGYCYENGYGVEQSTKTALAWYKRGIAQGDEVAKECLKDFEKKIQEKTVRVQDTDFGELVNEYDNWKAKSTTNFNGTECDLWIELEGSAQDKVTDEQRKAYAEYQENNDIFFEKFIKPSNGELLPRTLYIDREGNYLWQCTDKRNRESEIPLTYKKVHDSDFGDLLNLGDGWKGQTTTKFNDKGELAIELEGGAKDEITDAQRKAFAEYKEKEEEYFEAVKAKARDVYKGVDAIYPKALFIDRLGNYGWLSRSKTAILSDGNVQFVARESILYNYAEVVANRTKKEWHTGDSIYLNLLGELDSFCVERGSYEFEDDKDEEIRNGKLTEHEVELLLWLQTECNGTSRIADAVLAYCNDIYANACYYDKEKGDYVDCKPIKKTDLFNEIEFSDVCLMTQDHARNSSLPDMAIVGECECDPDHGIAICFSDKGFDGIGSHADVL